MARRQARRNPLNRRVFGGCHLNRPIDRLVSGAGFELTRLSTYYHRRPAADSYTYEGVATKPPRIKVPRHPRSFVPTGADLARPAWSVGSEKGGARCESW